jgi:hypothetical protein
MRVWRSAEAFPVQPFVNQTTPSLNLLLYGFGQHEIWGQNDSMHGLLGLHNRLP